MSRAGRAAYEAYAREAAHTGLVQGDGPLPLWPELPEPVRLAWDAAGTAAIASVHDGPTII